MQMHGKKGVERLLPIYGGSVPRAFLQVEGMPLPMQAVCTAGTLYGVGDNTTTKQLRNAFDAQSFAWFEGTYHNFLALYSSTSRHLERRAVAHVEQLKRGARPATWREMYLEHKRLLQDRARQLDRLMLAIDAEGRHAPGVARSPAQAVDSPMARVVREALKRASVDRPDQPFDGALLGSHSYMTLKSAAQYEIKGVPIAQLDNRAIKIRYNVFPPTRKDYLTLFANALQPGGPHHITPEDMRQCLEIGTGTGVLSFILNAYGAQRVKGIDINAEAIVNAKENRAILGKNEEELDFVQADLFPGTGAAKYDLVVCNPPWIPMPASEHVQSGPGPHDANTDGLMGGVLDRRGDMLPALLGGLTERLSSRGRLWLVYSNIAVRLGLQDQSWLAHLCDAHGLRVRAQSSLPARVRLHPQDPFYEPKKGEVLTLYEIVPKH